jgi:protoporphyrinogen oxidase
MKKIAIIGAGVGGMAAAWDLVRAGHQMTIFEGSDSVGGLASGFKDPSWDWSVEKYYHHWFQSDKDMLGLISELGWSDEVFFPRPKTVAYANGKFSPLDSPLAALTYPGFTLFDMIRFGFVSVYLRYLSSWQPLEKFTADAWMRKFYGPRLYSTLFEPLLIGKFGPHYKDVNMAWFWARFKTRTTRLGSFQGGFQAFCDRFAARLGELGVTIKLQAPVDKITHTNGNRLELTSGGKATQFDQVLVTTSPSLLARIVPDLPESYLKGLLDLKSMGAVVLVFSLKHRLSKEGFYWYNLPKSEGFPFLALVEHTNFISEKHFNNEHIVYCGDYLDPSHEYFKLSKEELAHRFQPSLKRINPEFSADWVRNIWLWKTNYAQPVPLINHSRNIPALKTPIGGLYFASMSQVYPWDRGTNFAVQVGRKAARMMLMENLG